MFDLMKTLTQVGPTFERRMECTVSMGPKTTKNLQLTPNCHRCSRKIIVLTGRNRKMQLTESIYTVDVTIQKSFLC